MGLVLPVYLAGLPNPIHPDMAHVALQQLDNGHAPNTDTATKMLLKWGRTTIYAPLMPKPGVIGPMAPYGMLTEANVANWDALYSTAQPIIRPADRKKLILSKCSSAWTHSLIAGINATQQKQLEDMYTPGWIDPVNPLVQFAPMADLKFKSPMTEPTPISHGVAIWGVSGSEWVAMGFFSVAAIAMQPEKFASLKAAGQVVSVIDGIVREAMQAEGVGPINRYLVDTRGVANFALNDRIRGRVAQAANAV